MRFALGEEQVEFSEAVRALLADTCGPEQVRSAWPDAELAGGGPGGGNGRVMSAWNALGEMGVLGIKVDEKHGGLGMTDEDLSPLLVEVGRSALPDPVSETAGVAVGVLTAVIGSGSGDGHAEDLLGSIAEGRISAGVMFAPGIGGSGAESPIATSTLVATAGSLDLLAVFVDGSLHLLRSEEITGRATESVDGSRCAVRVAYPPDGHVSVLEGADGHAVELAAFDRAALGASAQLLGLSRRMLELSVEYASERRQFGVPIGSFQAVKHRLADATLKVEFCEPLIMRAAYSLANGDADASTHISMAKAKVSTAAEEAAAASLQVHGAIGYTVECDLHLFMKRAWALSRQYGDAVFHRGRVRHGLGLAPPA